MYDLEKAKIIESLKVNPLDLYAIYDLVDHVESASVIVYILNPLIQEKKIKRVGCQFKIGKV